MAADETGSTPKIPPNRMLPTFNPVLPFPADVAQDIALAASFGGEVLISGPRAVAVDVARQIVQRDPRSHACRVSLCNAAQGDAEAAFQRAEAADWPTVLVIAEVHALTAIAQRRLVEIEAHRLANTHHPIRRIIATSSKDLLRCVEAGTFEDRLFYRLNAVHVMLPSARATFLPSALRGR
jgi:DNA-binding NtrC family response regulator